MEVVTNLTGRTRALIHDSAKITEGLNAMSGVLLGSVAQFRLPAGDLSRAEGEAIDLVEVFEGLEAKPLTQATV